MKIIPLQQNLQHISVQEVQKKKVELEDLDQKIQNSETIKAAQKSAEMIDGTEKDVVLANIDAASINPELINNVKFFNFFSEKDYQRVGKELGKKINIYDTDKS